MAKVSGAMSEERVGLACLSARLLPAKLEENGRAKPEHGRGSYQSQLGALRSIRSIDGAPRSFANWRGCPPEERGQVRSVKMATLEERVGLTRLTAHLPSAKLEEGAPGLH